MSATEPWDGVVTCFRCERDRRIINAYLAGENTRVIAKREGVVYDTIRNALKRHSVPRVRPPFGVVKFRRLKGYGGAD